MSDVKSYNMWLRGQNLTLSSTLVKSMDKLLEVLSELRFQSGLVTTLERYAISKDITKVEDLTSRLRHLGTLMERD